MEREFDAPLEDVWRAWTEASSLEKWWAPLPYKAVTKSMDFTEGGKWLYYMLSPEGEKHWCAVNYLKIIVRKNFTAEDAFVDEEGNLNEDLPNGYWTNDFTATSNGTKVNTTIVYRTEEDVQRILDMGMKEGITMAFNQLDDVFKKVSA